MFRDPLNWVAGAGLLVWGWVALFHRPVGDYAVETDFYGDFVPHARRLMQGHLGVLDGFRGPLYYLVLGALGEVLRNYFLAGKLLSMAVAAVSVRLAGGIVRARWGAPAGVVAAVFLAGNPVFAAHAFRACTDLVFLALFLGSLAAVIREDPERLRYWALGGALAGAAWLTRYTGAILAPAAVVAALLLVRPRRRAAASLALFAAAWAAVTAPWAIHLWRLTGDPLWNLNYQNIAIAAYAADPGLAQQGRFMSAVGFASLSEVVRVEPALVAGALVSALAHHLVDDIRLLVGPAWAAAAVLGWILGFRRRRFDTALLLAGCFTYLGLVPVFYNPRFMLPLLPFWAAGIGALTWAVVDGEGLVARLLRGGSPGLRRGLGVAVLAVVTGFAAAGNLEVIRASRNPKSNDSPPVILLGVAEKARVAGRRFDATTPVVARKPHIGYLLGTPVLPLPATGVAGIRETGARYLLVSGAEVLADPTLLPLYTLAGGADAPPGLTLIARSTVDVDGQVQAANLFEVQNPASWAPSPEADPRAPRSELHGFSRLDTVRGKLVAWYLTWEPDRPLDWLFDRMSAEAQRTPAVLGLRGDAAFHARRPAEADSLYRRALAVAPAAGPLLLRRASLAYLEHREDDYRSLLATYATGEFGSEVVSPDVWFALGNRLQSQGLSAPAVAPLAWSLELGQDRATGLKSLGMALLGLGRSDLALTCFRESLSLAPHDVEVRTLVERLATVPPAR